MRAVSVQRHVRVHVRKGRRLPSKHGAAGARVRCLEFSADGAEFRFREPNGELALLRGVGRQLMSFILSSCRMSRSSSDSSAAPAAAETGAATTLSLSAMAA